jgi:hypothetical protein
MAGLVPAIHVFGNSKKENVDARDERGHDELRERAALTKAKSAGLRICRARAALVRHDVLG